LDCLVRTGTASEEQALKHRLYDLLAIDRHGDGDPEGITDGAVFPEKHIEHNAVDLIVYAIVGQHPDLASLLAEPIYSAIPLLVASGIPREVVMNDGVEFVLKVDSLAEAVCADQTPTGGGAIAQPVDSCGTLFRSQTAGDAGDLSLFPQSASKFLRNVLGCLNEPAEYNGIESFS
jgi:hypothetical protein